MKLIIYIIARLATQLWDSLFIMILLINSVEVTYFIYFVFDKLKKAVFSYLFFISTYHEKDCLYEC